MSHPITTQIWLEFAAALRRGQPGEDVKFKVHVDPPTVENGFFVATCLGENGIPVDGIEPIEFRPN
ncbi:MAG: hypothetical protein PHZ04_01930 [Patescibacteria group bacterium]|nr:hypothetical protein [Patescibacteria group bacterium]MDD5294513.1 hypothetical protein [Patescibacteria group bacterium]MDD5555018.1 hypothetical protein [Patescibacteria group bacterium]